MTCTWVYQAGVDDPAVVKRHLATHRQARSQSTEEFVQRHDLDRYRHRCQACGEPLSAHTGPITERGCPTADASEVRS